MNRAGLWIQEFMVPLALLLTALFLFLLVTGTALVPTVGLGVGKDSDNFSTPPGSNPWWLLGLVIALAGTFVYVGLACARFQGRIPGTRVIGRMGPRVVRIAWIIGVAIIVMVDLAVLIGQRLYWGRL